MNSDYKEQTSIGSTYSGNQTTSKLGGNPDKPTEPKKNNHPTVKPISLMEYLIKLVTPKGGVVMDCFMGSGSTGIAARNLGFRFLGIEKEQEYFDIAKQRILP
jgi:site-specific DNA-methyltransferase (adenine-specific)